MRTTSIGSFFSFFTISSISFFLYSCDALYIFSGNVVGLKDGNEVSLENHTGDYVQTITVGEDGEFKFEIVNHSEYDVKIAKQPEDQTCTVINGKGDSGDSVNNIIVFCADSNS